MSTMSSYKRVQIKTAARRNSEVTPETRYWREFTNQRVNKLGAKITSIDSSQVRGSHDVAVSVATRVEIVDALSGMTKKTVSRFRDVVTHASIRADGNLLVGGAADGSVQVFDLKSRAVLRQFKKCFTGGVHVTRFCADNQHLLAAGDDKRVCKLSIPTEEIVSVYEGHTDRVRCGIESKSSENVWITGSYDHTVKYWDTRAPSSSPSSSCVLSLDHGEPVEQILCLGVNGNLLVSAGGNNIKVWDLTAGGKLLETVSNHQKSITSLITDGTGTRLFTGGLDKQVKIYDARTFQIRHSFSFNKEVMSLGVTGDNDSVVVGLLNGDLVFKSRLKEKDMFSEMLMSKLEEDDSNKFTGFDFSNKKGKDPAASSSAVGGGSAPVSKRRKYFMRGASNTPSQDAYVVSHQGRKQQLKTYDRFLKKFQYHAALDAALETQRAGVILSVVDELIARGTLRKAVDQRDEESLKPLLTFIVKQIDNPTYASVLIDLANIIVDLYSSMLGSIVEIDELFIKLQKKVCGEYDIQRQAACLMGSLDLLLGASEEADQMNSKTNTFLSSTTNNNHSNNNNNNNQRHTRSSSKNNHDSNTKKGALDNSHKKNHSNTSSKHMKSSSSHRSLQKSAEIN